MTHYGVVGEVDGFLEANVTLAIQSDNGSTESISFVIDTGYTAEMMLPQNVIERLDLPLADYDDVDVEVTLADGSTAVSRLHIANVTWHDRFLNVEVDNLSPEPLIGMGLMRGSNLSVDAAPGGLVTITELSDIFC